MDGVDPDCLRQQRVGFFAPTDEVLTFSETGASPESFFDDAGALARDSQYNFDTADALVDGYVSIRALSLGDLMSPGAGIYASWSRRTLRGAACIKRVDDAGVLASR